MGYLLITKVPFDTSITSLKLSPLMYFNILATISALACNKSLGPPMQEFSVTVGFGDLLLFFTFSPPSHPPPVWYNAHRKGVNNMKKYIIDGSKLPPNERFQLFQKIDKLAFMSGDWPPDINKETFTFYYEGDIEKLKTDLNINCPIVDL